MNEIISIRKDIVSHAGLKGIFLDLGPDAKNIFTQIHEGLLELARAGDPDTKITPNLESLMALLDIANCTREAMELWESADYSEKCDLKDSLSDAIRLGVGLISRRDTQDGVMSQSVLGARVLIDCLASHFAHAVIEHSSEKKSIKTYLIRNVETGRVKIGKSIDPEGRLKQLQGPSGSKLELVAVILADIESILHSRFAALRTVGEWFLDKDGEIEREFRAIAGEWGKHQIQGEVA